MGESYSCPSGGVIAGGRRHFTHNAMLDLLAAAPEGAWLKANTNTAQSVWPAQDYLPMFGLGPGTPSAIIRCWSGFGWDDINHRLVIFGGGHANYSGNDTYIWSAVTQQWQLAFYPSDVIANASGHQTIDGPLHSPISAHTYGNNNYLPKLNRFVTFGGACHSSGNPFIVTDSGGATLRNLPGGYTCDLSQAGLGKVGGLPGSNVKRDSTTGVSLDGASAWYARDWLLDHPQATLAGELIRHVNFFTCYREEAGKDVLYVAASSGGTNPSLYRVEYSDANNYLTDSISKVGRTWTNTGIDTGAALDTDNNVLIYLGPTGTYPIYGWDLDHAAPTLDNFQVANADLTGPGSAEFLSVGTGDMGLLYDPMRGYFVAWERGGRVWAIHTPTGDPVPTTGWYVEKLSDPVSPRPKTGAELGTDSAFTEWDKGVNGKWKYAKDLDCYVGLQGAFSGDVWLHKPQGWIDPRT